MSAPVSPKRNAVVLGAGLAGLAAAIRLKEHGVENVILLEREERPGGLAISLSFEGLASDLGPHRLYTEIPEVERFYKEVAGEDMMVVRRQSSMFLNSRFLHYPLGIADMLRGPGPFRLMQFGASWVWSQVKDASGRIDKQTYEGLMYGAFGKALFEYLIGPYTAKVWKTEPRTLDADAARVRVSAGSLAKTVKGLFIKEKKGQQTALKQFHYVKGGAQTLVNHLVRKAEDLGAKILTGHELAGLRLNASGAIEAVEARIVDGGKTISFPADCVISTIPFPHLVRQVDQAVSLSGEILREVSSLRYLDIVFVFAIVRRDLIRGDQWIYFPEPQYVFNRASEAKAFDPRMGAQGRSILCIETTCRQGQDICMLPDQEILSRVLDDLFKTGMISREELQGAYVHRLPFAYPIYDLNYSAKLEAALKEMARVPNLVTTGRQGLFNFNNMDHSIYMGLKAGECCVTAQNLAQEWLEEYKTFRSFRIVD